MNLEETINYCGLEGVFYVGASLCRLCVSSIFGVRVGFIMDVEQSVLAVIPLLGGVGFVGAFKTCAGCEVGLLSALWL